MCPWSQYFMVETGRSLDLLASWPTLLSEFQAGQSSCQKMKRTNKKQMRLSSDLHMHTFSCMHVHARTHSHTHELAHIHTCICSYLNMPLHAYSQENTCTCTKMSMNTLIHKKSKKEKLMGNIPSWASLFIDCVSTNFLILTSKSGMLVLCGQWPA